MNGWRYPYLIPPLPRNLWPTAGKMLRTLFMSSRVLIFRCLRPCSTRKAAEKQHMNSSIHALSTQARETLISASSHRHPTLHTTCKTVGCLTRTLHTHSSLFSWWSLVSLWIMWTKRKPLKSSLPKRPTFSTVFHGHLLVALANVLTKGSPEKLKPSFLERAAF